MQAKKWVISVLSTDYDLHSYREAIVSQLKEKDVLVSAFELSDFPVSPDKHSHESCLCALDRVDVALLIIDKRYGGIYIESDSNSITKEEYISVMKKQKPCLVFVSKSAWNEWYAYKKQFKVWQESHKFDNNDSMELLQKLEFDKQYVRTYVESVAVFDFLEYIQKSYSNYKASNWMDQFTDIKDLSVRIKGKLEGLTKYMLRKIVIGQKEQLESRHTSTGLGLSIGDVFSCGYYIDPTYSIESGELIYEESIAQSMKNTLIKNKSILVYGEAGYGKTTVLAKSYLLHVTDFLNNSSYDVPFYLWLKEKTIDFHFDYETYINESFISVCNYQPYPFLNLHDIRPYFYFDGFDEIGEKVSNDDISRISKSSILNFPVLLTCRQQYAYRYIDSFDFSDKFNIRVNINSWNIEKAKQYIEKFCKIKKKDDEFTEVVKNLLFENLDLQDILNTPLLITMLLWVIEQNQMKIPETIETRIELFNACIKQLAKRELHRLSQSLTLINDLVIMWSYVSWGVYLSKITGQQARIDEVITNVSELFPGSAILFSKVYIEVLFNCSETKILGTFHEQFLEFLVANTIFIACSDNKYPFPDFLNFVIRPEINRYFRAIWDESDKVKQNNVIKRLQEQYLYNVGKTGFFDVSKRVHAVYHILRMDSPLRREFIEQAFSVEGNISVLLSLYFGVIKLGNLNYEQNFFNLLNSSEEYNNANRGYHLAYYSDNIMGDTLPFFDNLDKDWNGTLKAFLRHFSSDTPEHYFLQRIDLLTMVQLIEARKKNYPLTKDILERIECEILSSSMSKANQEFFAKIKDALIILKQTFAKYS